MMSKHKDILIEKVSFTKEDGIPRFRMSELLCSAEGSRFEV